MSKTERFSLPQGAEVLSIDEMRKVEGGSVNVALTESFLDKDYCTNRANLLLRRGKVVGMSTQEIAEELYAHAVVKYNSTAVLALGTAAYGPLGYLVAKEMVESASDGAAIEDYGDSAVRKAFYSVVWTLF